MLKKISAALLAVAVLAAPALAATPSRTAQAPIVKTTKAPVGKTAQIKPVPTKSSVLNANARMGRHHGRHHHHRHFRHAHRR